MTHSEDVCCSQRHSGFDFDHPFFEITALLIKEFDHVLEGKMLVVNKEEFICGIVNRLKPVMDDQMNHQWQLQEEQNTSGRRTQTKKAKRSAQLWMVQCV